jgi:hypothetical protein
MTRDIEDAGETPWHMYTHKRTWMWGGKDSLPKILQGQPDWDYRQETFQATGRTWNDQRRALTGWWDITGGSAALGAHGTHSTPYIQPVTTVGWLLTKLCVGHIWSSPTCQSCPQCPGRPPGPTAQRVPSVLSAVTHFPKVLPTLPATDRIQWKSELNALGTSPWVIGKGL